MVAEAEAAGMVEVLLEGSGCARGGYAPIGALNLSENRQSSLEIRCKNANSALVGVFPYYAGPQAGPVSLYTRGFDYLPVLKNRLGKAASLLRAQWPQAEFTVLPNCAPLPAVALARAAGVALAGRNGLAICPPYGSYCFLGAIVTDLTLPPSLPAGTCQGCGLCQKACPTAALSSRPEIGAVLDRRRCLSCISQLREPDAEQQALLKKSPTLWGCDLCQTVCPHNSAPALSPLPEFTRDLLAFPLNADAIGGLACGRYGLEHLQRNAEICGLEELLQ